VVFVAAVVSMVNASDAIVERRPGRRSQNWSRAFLSYCMQGKVSHEAFVIDRSSDDKRNDNGDG
jgi:hypothetical protein